MAHNLSTSADAEFNFMVSQLRDGSFDQPIASGDALIPGCFFQVDPAGQQEMHLTSGAGEGLKIRTRVQHPGDWMALHLRLEGLDLSDKQVLGFLCKSQSPQAMTYRACLRSGTETGFHDCFFTKTLVAYDQPSSHLDVLDLSTRPDVPLPATWREFIFFFKPSSFDLELQDLRFFIV